MPPRKRSLGHQFSEALAEPLGQLRLALAIILLIVIGPAEAIYELEAMYSVSGA